MKGWQGIIDGVAVAAGTVAVVVGVQYLVANFRGSAEASPQAERVIADWQRYAAAGHRMGPPDPPVTIIEFGDYQCPACRAWEPHVRSILEKYPGDVAFVYRHFPLSYHQYAYAAARAAECADKQGRFWEFHRLLFDYDDWLGDAMFRFAQMAGITDSSAFRSCIADPEPVLTIETDINVGTEVGVAGTPTVIVNGQVVAARDSISLGHMIEQILREQS